MVLAVLGEQRVAATLSTLGPAHPFGGRVAAKRRVETTLEGATTCAIRWRNFTEHPLRSRGRQASRCRSSRLSCSSTPRR